MNRWAASVACLALAAPARAELPPAHDCAGVYWDLTAVFESGDRIFARVLLSRVGPGELSAAGQGHWLAPDATATPFQNGRAAGRFEIAAEGRALRIGSTEQDLAAVAHRFEVDNDKRGVKLRVEVAASDAVSLPVHAGDLAIEVLHLGSAARASLWRAGMAAPRSASGFASWVRTTHARCERDLAALRVDVHRLADGGSSLLIHERVAGGAERSWFGWRDTAGGLHTRRPASLTLADASRDTGGERLPRRLAATDPGLSGGIAIGPAFLAVDPLDALPRLVRMLYWFGASPRRVWADADVGLSSNPPPSRGPGLASFTFLRDPPPNLPPEPGR